MDDILNGCISEKNEHFNTDFFNYVFNNVKSFRFRFFLFILLIYIAGATLDVTNTNPGSRFMLTKSIAKYGEFTIQPEDQERYSYLDYSIYNGSIYSDKAPGLSLLAVPIYWLGDFIAINVLGIDSNNWQLVDDFIKFLTILVVLIFGAFTALKFYDFLKLLGVSHQSANWTTLLFAFGSLFYVYIGTFFAHAIVAAFILLALYFSTKFQRTREIHSLVYSSLFAGFTVVCDYVTVFMIPFILIYTFIPIPWNIKEILTNKKYYIKFYFPAILLYLIPLAICALLVLFYNFSCFGDPFVTPYKYSRFFGDKQHFANSMIFGLDVLIFSRHHGLLHFMPIIMISTIGLIPMFKKNPSLAVLCITMPLLIILLYSKYFLPTGGLAYGPRHIVSIIPLLIMPLGFLLDLNDHGNPISTLREAFYLVLIQVLKICSIFLSFLSFLINFAGGWVGVYPLGGEGMSDPIWGTSEQMGHLQSLFSWFYLSFSDAGVLSLEFLQGSLINGIPTYGFQIKVLLMTFRFGLHNYFASSLARGDIGAFFGILLLAFLINPYFSPLKLNEKLSRSINSIFFSDQPKKYLYVFLVVELSLFFLFAIWIVIDGITIIGEPLRKEILAFWSFISKKYDLVDDIPLLNLILRILGFFVVSVVNLIFFRYNIFSLSSWFLNSIIFLIVINFVWIPFKQIKNYSQNDLDDIKTNKIIQTNDSYESLFNSDIFAIYLTLGKTLAISYLLVSLISLIRFSITTASFYSNFSLIVHYFIFVLIFSEAMIPFSSEYTKSKLTIKNNIKTDMKNESSQFSLSSKISYGVLISVILFSMLFLFVTLNIIIILVNNGFNPFEVFFIHPLFIFGAVDDWFIHVEHPVSVYLMLVLALVLILLLTSIYQLGSDIGIFPRSFLKFSEPIEKKLTLVSSDLSLLQAILIFGGILVLFIYLLLTLLYSLLSTVPDVSLLPEPLKEYPEEFKILTLLIIGYIFGVFYSSIHYLRHSPKIINEQSTN